MTSDAGERGHEHEVDVGPDLARARGLLPSQYADPIVFAHERARVFSRSWQIAASASAVAAVGAYVTAELAGEPVLVVRAAPGEGGLRAFFNVCPHRAGPVARGCGRRAQLRCGYHGWTFSLDGALVQAPEAEGCDLSGVALTPISVASWGPLVFVAIEPAAPLREVLAGIAEPDPSLAWVMRRDYELEANWKVYVDNYLEGYHVPIVHPGLYAELDYPRYRTETSTWWSEQIAPLRPAPSAHAPGEAASVAPEGGAPTRVYRPSAAGESARYHWVFPNVMLNAYQGILQTNLVVPLGPDRTRVAFEWYADAPTPALDDARWRELVGFSEVVQEEDRAICETVQRNLGSRGAVRARYVPARENGVHHFHRLYAAALR